MTFEQFEGSNGSNATRLLELKCTSRDERERERARRVYSSSVFYGSLSFQADPPKTRLTILINLRFFPRSPCLFTSSFISDNEFYLHRALARYKPSSFIYYILWVLYCDNFQFFMILFLFLQVFVLRGLLKFLLKLDILLFCVCSLILFVMKHLFFILFQRNRWTLRPFTSIL